MVSRADRIVLVESVVFVGLLALVFRLDTSWLWLTWAVLTAVVAGITLVWLNTSVADHSRTVAGRLR